MIGYRIQRWLEWSGAWEPKPRFAPWLPISQGRLITLGLLAGVIMTMVRGPWMGAILAAMLVMIGRSRQRVAAIGAVIAFLIFVGVPGVVWFLDYVSVGARGRANGRPGVGRLPLGALDRILRDRRREALVRLGPDRLAEGAGHASIDNYYLLLLLMHGLIALACLLAIILIMLVRLTAHGMRQPLAEPRGSSLAFTLASLYLAIAFSIATVYLGLQTVPLLFLITGWGIAYLDSGVEGIGTETAAPPEPTPAHRFSRVVT